MRGWLQWWPPRKATPHWSATVTTSWAWMPSSAKLTMPPFSFGGGPKIRKVVEQELGLAEGQPLGERLPLLAAGPAAPHAQLAVDRAVVRVAGDRDDVDRLRLVGVDVDDEPEVGGQVAADLLPRLAGVVAAHDVPVLLHEQRLRP